MARKYFGTDGVRGLVGVAPITPDFVMRLGYAAGKVLTRAQTATTRPTVLIGKDTRISGYMLEAALEAGAEDVIPDDEGGFEVLCPPLDFTNVKDALEKAGFKAEVAEIIMKPATETVFSGDDGIKMQKLLDALENLDDVQEVFSNALIED